jgi:hypothetical protein
LQLECQLLNKEKEDAPRRSGADEYEINGSYNDGPACNQGAFFNRGVPASLAGLSSLMKKMPAMLGVNVNTGARITGTRKTICCYVHFDEQQNLPT